MTLLAIIWFGLAALLLAVYAVLDGFDLGVGILYGFMPKGEPRRAALESISPIWNGNEVFLLAGVGSVLAAFPIAYGSLLSGMYIPVMLTLVGLIFRAAGIELRTKAEHKGLAGLLDALILIGSLIPAWAIGVVAGNVLVGFPIDASGYPVSDFLGYLNPFALFGGLISIAAFVLHGLVWLNLKLSGAVREQVRKTFLPVWIVVAAFLAVAAVWGMLGVVRAENAAHTIPGLVVVVVALVALLLAFRADKAGWAFIASAVVLVGAVASCALALFPLVIPSRLDPKFDITVASAASSDTSLGAMLVIALIGVPLVVVYVVVLYRTFRKKVS